MSSKWKEAEYLVDKVFPDKPESVIRDAERYGFIKGYVAGVDAQQSKIEELEKSYSNSSGDEKERAARLVAAWKAYNGDDSNDISLMYLYADLEKAFKEYEAARD